MKTFIAGWIAYLYASKMLPIKSSKNLNTTFGCHLCSEHPSSGRKTKKHCTYCSARNKLKVFNERKSKNSVGLLQETDQLKKSALIFGSKSKFLLMKNEKESLKTNYKKKIYKIKNIDWEQKVKLLDLKNS